VTALNRLLEKVIYEHQRPRNRDDGDFQDSMDMLLDMHKDDKEYSIYQFYIYMHLS